MVARIVVLAWLAGAVAGSLGCASAAKSEMRQQWDFGVEMARRGAWKEALFRFRRSVELTPENALVHNNLAVAYESVGDYRKADGEYRRAVELAPKNEQIRANYTSFQTFYGDLLQPDEEPDSGTAQAGPDSL